MKVLKGINNISEELKKSIPALKGLQTFRLLTGVTVVDPETGKSELRFATTLVPTKDRIKDPHTGSYVDIGVVSEFDAASGEVIDTRKVIVGGKQSNFNGLFDLREGNVDDEELWEFLYISNYNKSNPHRDKSKKALFELINVQEESKQRTKRRNDLADALMIAREMNLPEVKEFALALNHNDTDPDYMLRDFVEEYAKENPSEFIKSFKNPVFKVQATIKRSIDKGFIQYDPGTRKVKWAGAKGVTITTIGEEEDKDWLMLFAEYCHTSPAGEAVLKGLRKKLKEETISEPVNE